MRFVYLKQRFTPRGVKDRIPEASTDHFQRLNLFKRSSLAKLLFEMTFGWLVSAAPRQLPPLIKCDGQVEAGLKVWQPQPWGGARTVSCKETLWNLLCSPQDFSVGEHLTVLQKDLSQEQIWEGCRSRNVGSWSSPGHLKSAKLKARLVSSWTFSPWDPEDFCFWPWRELKILEEEVSTLTEPRHSLTISNINQLSFFPELCWAKVWEAAWHYVSVWNSTIR